jgi:hypothetical protein
MCRFVSLIAAALITHQLRAHADTSTVALRKSTNSWNS